MTTPTQTEYGPEIVVDGVKPGWYRGESIQWSHISNPASFWLFEDGGCAVTAGEWGAAEWAEVSRIRLPASHAYYITAAHNAKHGTQFKYWPGGAERPSDYEGGPVLYRDEQTFGRIPVRWKHYEMVSDIIGYTPKPCATSVHSADATDEWQPKPPTEALKECVQLYRDSQKQPDFVPCERTLRMAMDKLPEPLTWETSHQHRDQVVEALESMLPKKDRAEELVEVYRQTFQNPDVVACNMDAERDFAKWLQAQGEIRG